MITVFYDIESDGNMVKILLDDNLSHHYLPFHILGNIKLSNDYFSHYSSTYEINMRCSNFKEVIDVLLINDGNLRITKNITSSARI